ncbi:CRP/FNR family transcriptional regulator [Evansella vedderi]|uniref:CRP/FNR family transcriptional regulator n=1 Tax=Evansella vedderi TaxID=38282 RepID=A0ABU0A0M5_9BACI|nr:Crp/Fnr family transcriptional regulator [Evansella vedderi]MDQ0256557.1 CRP/FNR family transcriptional regulator [Evansella vedderi]
MIEARNTVHPLSLYEQLTKQTKTLFESYGSEIQLKKGSVLFYEGDKADHIFLIEMGKVRLTKTSAEGKVFFLQIKKRHDIIGELSLYNAINYHFNAEIVQDTILHRYNRKDVEELLLKNNELAVCFMKSLSTENHTILSQFRDLIFCGKEGAVYSILIRLSNEYGKEISTGLLINRKITNQELANYIGATRESINRILKRLIKNNIISVNTKYITIHNIDYLKEHLRCKHCPATECTI